jgi:hypothetical protein
MTDAEHAVREAAADIPAKVRERLDTAEELSDEDRERLSKLPANRSKSSRPAGLQLGRNKRPKRI